MLHQHPYLPARNAQAHYRELRAEAEQAHHVRAARRSAARSHSHGKIVRALKTMLASVVKI